MEKKELSRREILERLWVTSDELYLVATSKREHLLRKPIGADLINIGSLKAEIKQELDKAREEGREEGINAVLFPKFKRDKNGTLKREGWVDTSKLEDK